MPYFGDKKNVSVLDQIEISHVRNNSQPIRYRPLQLLFTFLVFLLFSVSPYRISFICLRVLELASRLYHVVVYCYYYVSKLIIPSVVTCIFPRGLRKNEKN